MTDDSGACSSSVSGGETNLAVGFGPVLDGPRVFLRMGCGIGALFLDEDDDSLPGLFFARFRAVVLEAPGPPCVLGFYFQF